MSSESTEWRPSAAPPYRVLIVDDNEGSAKILALLLQKFWQHEVHICHDGPSALALAETVLPQIVLLDIRLPGLSGHDVARSLRQQQQFQQTLLVALTGYDDDENRARAAEAGFDLHVVKPPDVTKLESLFHHPKLSGN